MASNNWDLNSSIASSALREAVGASTPGEHSWKLPPGRICVNRRWKQSPVLECLKKSRCQVIFSDDDSSVVDFHPSDGVAVVYLSEADCVLNTAYDYRRKLAKLRNNRGVRGLVFFEKSEMTVQYLQPVQQFAVLDLGLVLLTVADQAEAAQLLLQISSIESNERSNAFRVKKSWPSFDDCVPRTLLQIPGLGEARAKLLASRYKSIANIGRATKEDLSLVIGKSAANQVWDFFR